MQPLTVGQAQYVQTPNNNPGLTQLGQYVPVDTNAVVAQLLLQNAKLHNEIDKLKAKQAKTSVKTATPAVPAKPTTTMGTIGKAAMFTLGINNLRDAYQDLSPVKKVYYPEYKFTDRNGKPHTLKATTINEWDDRNYQDKLNEAGTSLSVAFAKGCALYAAGSFAAAGAQQAYEAASPYIPEVVKDMAGAIPDVAARAFGYITAPLSTATDYITVKSTGVTVGLGLMAWGVYDLSKTTKGGTIAKIGDTANGVIALCAGAALTVAAGVGLGTKNIE